MTFTPVNDFALQCALGLVEGYGTESKFGRATDCDSGVPTDIWDGADGVSGPDVYVPPTDSRLHDIASTNANDTVAGTGARRVRVYGLRTWGEKETSEVVELNGVGAVATKNAYVFVHRMKVIEFGSAKTTLGNISATAQTDLSLSAQISAGANQTLMAVYAVPSVQTFALTQIGASLLTGTGGAAADAVLLVNENPPDANSGFLIKGADQISDSAPLGSLIYPPVPYPGPCIMKIQVETDTNNVTCAGAFRGFLVDNPS